MSNLNFTPLDNNLLKKREEKNTYNSPEKEPGVSLTIESPAENIEKSTENLDSAQKESEVFVTKTEEKPNLELHPDLKKAGLQAIDTSSLDPKHVVELPISDLKILSGLKSPPSSGLRWLAERAKLTLSKAHLALKVVHGKVVRIIKK